MTNGEVAQEEVFEARPVDVVDESNPFADPEGYDQNKVDNFLEPLSDNRGPQDADIVALRTEENLEVLRAIPAKLEEIKNKYWELAELVAKVFNDKLYLLMDCKNFEEYVDGHLGVKRRKGYIWASMYNYFTRDLKAILANNPELYQKYLQQAKSMGWSKAAKIADQKCITSENAELVYERVTWDNDTRNKPTFQKLQNILSEEKSKLTKGVQEELDKEGNETVVPEVEPMMNFTARLTKTQNSDVEAALEYAMKVSKPGSKKGTLLSWVCRDYLNTNQIATGQAVDVKTLFQRLEDQLGCTIVALDEKGDKIYGAGGFAADEESETTES